VLAGIGVCIVRYVELNEISEIFSSHFMLESDEWSWLDL
jgi:hypothetical protein